MKSLAWILVCGALWLPSLGRAQDTWESVGPYGGWIHDLKEDGVGRILAATYFGGVYRSSDGAESWQQIYTGSLIFDPRCVAVNAAGHIFIGSEGIDGVGFLRSTDDGATWQLVSNNLSSRLVIDLLVAPNQDVFACTFDDGLFRSTNSGTTFTQVSALPASYTTVIAAGAAGRLYVGVQNESANLYRSTNGGVTWQQADTGVGSDVTHIHAAGSAVYATAGQLVYKSTDDGVTWTSLGAPAGLYYNSSAVAGNGDIYASYYESFLAGYGVARSTNGGATWTADSGLPGSAVDGLLATSGGMLFLAGKGPGVYRRVTGAPAGGVDWELKVGGMANTWIKSIAEDPGGGMLYTGTANALVFRSPDSGLTWQSAAIGIPFYEVINDVAVNTDGTVFASGAAEGIYRSTDEGDNWVNVHFAAATAVACNAQGHLFAGQGNRVYRSTDNGGTWTYGVLSTVQWIADIACDGTTVYAATGTPGGLGSKGVYRSTNNGDTWSAFNDGLTDLNVTCIAVGEPGGAAGGGSPCNTTAGTFASGILDLNSLGAWVQDPDVSSGRIVRISKRSAVRGQDGEAVARLLEVLTRGDNSGCEREVLPFNPFGHFWDVLAGAPGGGRGSEVIWGGTVGHGIIRYAPSTPAEVTPEEAARSIPLARNEPNPFHRSTTIEFVVTDRGFVELQIFDAAGREVETLVRGQREPGRYEIIWDAGERPSGVYFSRLSTSAAVRSRSLVLLR